MTSQPYASARRVFWIVDNGSSHRGPRTQARLRERWPAIRVVHTPIHASWLNQVELYFSVIQRKVLDPNQWSSSTAVEGRAAGVRRAPRDRHAVRVALHPRRSPARPGGLARTDRGCVRPYVAGFANRRT